MNRLLFAILLFNCFCGIIHSSIIMQPYLMSVSTNSVYVLVETNTPDTVTVQYGLTSSYGLSSKTSLISVTQGSTYIHKVYVQGLSASTLYYYRAVQGASISQGFYFRTAVNPGTPYKFVWMADYRTGVAIHDQIAVRAALRNPLFILNGGDVCEFKTYASWKNEFFRTNELNLISRVPFYYAPGNHEGWNDSTKAFIRNPASSSGTQDYYSFDYGDFHFVSINNYVAYNQGSPQYNYVQNDLSSTTKPWKIVFCHKPPYCAGGHGNDSTMIAMAQNVFIPNNVDVVFSGHSHFFQHNKVGNIHYMVIGSCGAPLYDPDTASYILKSVKDYCYGVIETTPNSFYVRVYNNLDTLLDTLRLTKLVSGIPQTENKVFDYILYPNYPNPFNNSTIISYQLAVKEPVSLSIFDINGREVEVLVNGIKEPGIYKINLNAGGYSSGIYYYRLTTQNYSETRKMVLLK